MKIIMNALVPFRERYGITREWLISILFRRLRIFGKILLLT